MSDGLKLIAKLIEDGAVSGFRELDEDMFIDTEVDVFNFVRAHHRRHGGLPNIETLMEETGVDLPETPEISAFYLEKLADRHTYNNLKRPFQQLRVALVDYNVESAREAISSLQTVSRVTSSSQDLRNVQEIGESRLAYAREQRVREGLSGITTGWATLDDATGGYQNGDLVTWAARPGMGKTYYLLYQALSAWNAGHSVMFVSMEMSLDQLGNRLFGMMTDTNPRAFRDGRISTRHLRKLRDKVTQIQGEGRFNLYAGNFNKNVEDTESLMMELNPDILFIDGVYLMGTEGKFKKGGRYDIAADVFDYLKQMTITHARPIVVTTKFAKAAGKSGEEGSLENIGYTDAVGTHSSIVIGLKEGEAPAQDTERRAVVLKGREGEEGTYRLSFSFKPMNFNEVNARPEADVGQAVQEVQNHRENSSAATEQGWTPNSEGED
jgi:hypothetical protein